MIVDRQRKVKVSRKPLENFLRRLRAELNVTNAEVSIALVSDAEIARLNAAYRHKSGPTDVLSFPAQPRSHSFTSSRRALAADERPLFLGDIVIAPQTAGKYARKNGRTLPRELQVLILHGVLHLLGYDHETDRGQMKRIERRLRRRLGLA